MRRALGSGAGRLARDPALSPYRAFAVAYPLLGGVFLVTGGKPYYTRHRRPFSNVPSFETPRARTDKDGVPATRL